MTAQAQMERVAPILPARDVAAALAHYRQLGFEVRAYGPPDAPNPEYGFVRWGAVELHLSHSPDHDPKTTASCCYISLRQRRRCIARGLAGGEGWRPARDTR